MLLVCGLCASVDAQDSLRVRGDSLVVPYVEPTGLSVGSVPVTIPEVDVLNIAGEIPGALLYEFGDTGWADGVSLDGQSPQRMSLSLDGLPFSDLFTERPHLELLPAAVLDRFRLESTHFGRLRAFNAQVRPLAGSTPITELKFLTGQEGMQYVSASHAQTRTPPGLLGGDGGRLGFLGHVSGTQSDGQFAGGALRSWQALGRLSLSRLGFAATLTEFHTKHTVGARSGVAPDFPAAYNPATATVLDAAASRETSRNDLALSIRLPLGPDALTMATYWTRQHERFSPTGLDTSFVRGNRFGGQLVLPFRTGDHHLSLHADGWWDDAAGGQSNPFVGIDARTQIHGTLSDSVSVSGWGLKAEAGVHSVASEVFPSGQFRVERSGAFVGLSYAGHVPGRIEMTGYGDQLTGLAAQSSEQTASGEAGFELHAGSFQVALRGFASLTSNPRSLVDDGAGSAAFQDLSGSLRRAGGSLYIGWRANVERGFYANATVNGSTVLNPDDSDLHLREADALPAVWANGRLGVRADALFSNNLDIDLAAQGRAWSAFRSRSYIPQAALFALPAASSPEVPTSGMLDLVVEARLQQRATLFFLYENVLSTRTYDGAFIVPIYPLPAHRVRFGLFWTLFG